MSSFGYLIKEGFKNIFHNRLMSLASTVLLIRDVQSSVDKAAADFATQAIGSL